MLERRVRKPIWTVLGSNLTKSHKKAIALSSMPRTTKLHLSSGVIQHHGLFWDQNVSCVAEANRK